MKEVVVGKKLRILKYCKRKTWSRAGIASAVVLIVKQFLFIKKKSALE